MKSISTTLLLLCISMIGNAQKIDSRSLFSDRNQLTFYLLDVEDGLSNNYINHIEQDSLGFIWIATVDGLNRYDGHNFQVYRNSTLTRPNGPASNYVEHLEFSPDQQLLLATDKGLSGYDPRTNYFSHFEDVIGLSQNSVSDVLIGPNQQKIVANYEGDIQIISADSIVDSYSHAPSRPNSLSSIRISSLTLQGDSVLWVGYFDKGLDKIDLRKKTVTAVSTSNPTFPTDINSLYTDESSNVWVGSNDGLRVITSTADTLSLPSADSPERGLSDGIVLCFEKDFSGNLWIGTRNGGLNILNPSLFLKEKAIQLRWLLPQQDGSSVFNRTVSSLKLTRDGYMWIGTSTGLNYVNPLGEPIKLLNRNLSKKKTLSHDRIGALAGSKDGSIWIGTDGGGLDRYFPQDENIQHYEHDPNNPQSLSNNYIISLLEDSKSNVWVGTYQGGLNLLNPDTGKSKHYLQESQEEGNDVRVIYEGKNGQIWVGTNRGGLYRYHPPIDNFDYVKQLGKIDIRDIAEDELGNLWLATFGSGIIRYNYLTGEQEQFNENTVVGFPGEAIFGVEILANGDVLAGSRYEGLIRLNPTSKKIILFTDENGLSNNSINSLVRGKNGMYWLGTYRGISFFDPDKNSVGNLNSINNIQLSEFNIGAAMTAQSGEIYLGGNKGINVFDPETLENESQSYSIIFTDLRLMNKKVMVDTEENNFRLEHSLPFLRQLNLDHDQTLISLDFVALKFPIGKDVKYAYLLEPYHSQWIQTDHTGTANLSNIPPGNYILKVKASTGVTDISESQLAINIAPPFWKTWPAYLLYFFTIILLVIAGMRYYAERLKLKNSLLFEKKQRHLEHELNQERIQFFTGFSHELKTPLTLIMAPVEDLLLEIKNTRQLKGLKLIQKNTKYLHEMISKLLEFRNAELDVNVLNLKSKSINKPIRQWVKTYQHLANHKGIKLKSSVPRADVLATIDIQKLHIIFNNLVSNALKYCEPKDQINISLIDRDDEFELLVSDNGPGIPWEDQEHIFKWYYQSGQSAKGQGTGIGLAMTKRLVEDHHGSIKVQSEPGKGCAFSILIPKEVKVFAAFSPEKTAKEEWLPDKEHVPMVSAVNFDLKENREVLLIIDDNPQILEYLNLLLCGDYDLIYASNGQEGLEKATRFIPDLIISDIMMPERNGFDLCGILKENQGTTHIPVILLSAKDNTESITSGFGKGADDYITKPFKGEILKSRIKNLLEAKIRMRAYYLGKSLPKEELTSLEKNAINREKSFLTELERHILAGISQQITDVDTISHAMGMSRTSLFRKLKALTGQNINQYIRTVKVTRAAFLIKEEKLGVAQAAYEVGFNSIKHFRKHFKEQFGYLPSEAN